MAFRENERGFDHSFSPPRTHARACARAHTNDESTGYNSNDESCKMSRSPPLQLGQLSAFDSAFHTCIQHICFGKAAPPSLPPPHSHLSRPNLSLCISFLSESTCIHSVSSSHKPLAQLHNVTATTHERMTSSHGTAPAKTDAYMLSYVRVESPCTDTQYRYMLQYSSSPVASRL